MLERSRVGLGVAVSCLTLHCVGGQPPSVQDAAQAMRLACEALAVSVTTGSRVPVDEVIAKACKVERVLARMQALAGAGELLVEEFEAPAPDVQPMAPDGGN